MPLIINNDQKKVEVLEQWQRKLNEITASFFVHEKINDSAEVSLLFVDDENIRQLNKTYRNKDSKTDCLSFPAWEGQVETDLEIEVLLGDIVISLETAQEQAEEFGHSLSREICYLYVHGLLHLLGYDHLEEEDKKKMREAEEKILEDVGVRR